MYDVGWKSSAAQYRIAIIFPRSSGFGPPEPGGQPSRTARSSKENRYSTLGGATFPNCDRLCTRLFWHSGGCAYLPQQALALRRTLEKELRARGDQLQFHLSTPRATPLTTHLVTQLQSIVTALSLHFPCEITNDNNTTPALHGHVADVVSKLTRQVVVGLYA
eukprot:4623613-Pyramimonas_sp.AAC.2